MRRLMIVLALVVAMLTAFAPAAHASVYCALLDKLGYEWVRECEGPVA